MVPQWSPSNSKSPLFFRTQLSCLADVKTAVVWMVSYLLRIFNCSSPLSKCSGAVMSAPTTVGKAVNLIFHSFYFYFSSLARSKYLSIFSISFVFSLWSSGTVIFTRRQFLFLMLVSTRYGLLAGIR